MRHLAATLGTSLLLLALVALLLSATGDGHLLVPPPEAAGEQFFRKLATGRYALARSHLTAARSADTDVAALRDLTRLLEQRLGTLRDARGDSARIAGDSATAWVWLRGARDTLTTVLSARREHTVWTISDYGAARLATAR